MVEFPRFQANSRFVMPAKAGIQIRIWFSFKRNLDTGLRRYDGNTSRLLVDEISTLPLDARGD
jgi:hypothetical protein